MDRVFDRVALLKRVLALVSGTVALASLTLAPAPAQAPTDEQLRALESQMLDLINGQRASFGRAPLAWSPQLASAARRHARDMATNNFVGHIGSDASSGDTRIKDAGYQAADIGENNLGGANTADQALASWMNDEADRETILRPTLTEIGIAVEYNANTRFGYYWAAEFGTPASARPQGPTDEEYQALEARLVELVNEERLKVGSNPLVRSGQLNHAAWRYSWDMALNGAWNHLGSDNTWTEDRIHQEGYQFSKFGENITRGESTPEEAMAWWKTSPGHWANLLDPAFTEIGVALAFNPDSEFHYYWTQVFARPR